MDNRTASTILLHAYDGRKARATLAVVGALIVLWAVWLGPLGTLARDLFAAHMLQHLFAMNVAALLLAIAARARIGIRGTALPAAAVLQLALLWLWHTPAAFAATHATPVLLASMQVSLFAAALWFWLAILGRSSASLWHRAFALLLTAKGFCLLGAVFVFARRPLYPHAGNPDAWGLSPLQDQQLAGLLMVSACALVYVAAAIVLFARWMFAAEAGAVSK